MTLRGPQQVSFTPLPVVKLVGPGTKVEPPSGIVYSTDPHTGFDITGREFVYKGPAAEVVVAEALAHVLAGHIRLAVPGFALVRFGNSTDHHFGSEKIAGMRQIDPWIQDHKNDIAKVIAFDVWICNIDRNVGNLLGRDHPSHHGDIEVIAIDFEKSVALRSRYPLVECGNVDVKKLWPKEMLGVMMTGAQRPREFAAIIEAVEDATIDRACATVAAALPSYAWGDATREALKRRRADIRKLLKEVWQ